MNFIKRLQRFFFSRFSKPTNLLLQTNNTAPFRTFVISPTGKLILLFLCGFTGLGLGGFFFSLTLWSYQRSALNYHKKENIQFNQDLSLILSRRQDAVSKIESIAKVEENLKIASGLPDDFAFHNYAIGGSKTSDDLFKEMVNPILGKFAKLDLLDNTIKFNLALTHEHLKTLQNYTRYKLELWQHTPLFKPSQGRFTSRFGYRIHPLFHTRVMHNGLDIAAPRWTPVYAPADGEVSSIKSSKTFGKQITMDHGNGYSTYYAHLQKRSVKSGQLVERHDLIGYIGDSGLSTGTHLHYEIHRDGKPVNPENFILPSQVLVD